MNPSHPRPASSAPVSRLYTSEMYDLTSSADSFIDDVGDTVQRRAEFQQEFRKLSISQQQLLQKFVQGGCYSNLTLSRAKPCDRTQNVNELLTIIKALVSPRSIYCICRFSSLSSFQVLYMKCRCGIEGIFCVVRDNTEYEFDPQWFFTSPEIDTFLAGAVPLWDINVIAMELEGFGVTGCNMYREWRASAASPQFLISCIVSAHMSSRTDDATWSRKEVLRKLHLSYGICPYFDNLDCNVSANILMFSHCCQAARRDAPIDQS